MKKKLAMSLSQFSLGKSNNIYNEIQFDIQPTRFQWGED
jgi:hypothetical protein